MMPVVTDYLFQLVTKQVDEKSLVVWYDPEQAYVQAAKELSIPKTTVARYDGSFFKLRREIDHRMNDGQPPKLVVYIPLERTETAAALIELDYAGVIMQPRQQPPTCNTRLSVIARNALKPILGEDQVVEIERQVEAGKLSLADLNSLADKGKDISTGVLALIFGSANPQEVALAFLHSDKYDEELKKKDAEKELRRLLEVSFDLELPQTAPLSTWRSRLEQHVLLTDILSIFKADVPEAFSSYTVTRKTGSMDACVRLAQNWRNSRDVRDSYVLAANRIEKDRGVGQLNLPTDLLSENETFQCVERRLLSYVEGQLLKTATPELLKLAEYRLSRFWSDVVPAIQARWALISTAAEVLLEADRVSKALKNAPSTIPALIKAYSDDDQPWCMLDTHHRHMESRKYNFEFAANNEHAVLEQLLTKAEQRYTEVGSALAKLFVTTFSKTKHPVKGVSRQRETFEKQVKPLLGDGKVAYVWVDALRYEMARELSRLLTDDFTLEIQPAIAEIPTITEIGMAALLPKANGSPRVVSAGGGKLALEIDGKMIKDRKDRVAFLKDNAGVPVFDAKLEDLLPKPTKRVKDGIQAAQLILITSQEIDELGEADNMAQARLQIDGVLSQLRRGVRVLADNGIKSIVLVADHGHLFADEISDDMKIESPGGKVEDLHRRVWVGVGGNTESSCLRTSLTSLGVDSEFDISTPLTFAVFKSKGGGRAYFHGGLSPQELIIPIVTMSSTMKPPAQTGGIEWTLTPGTPKLTTRFFSVQIAGSQSESSLFGFEPPKVRIELRANRKPISTPVSASYGFEDATGEVSLRISESDKKRIEPNTVTVVLSEEITQKTVGVYLLDATTGAELTAPVMVDVAISM